MNCILFYSHECIPHAKQTIQNQCEQQVYMVHLEAKDIRVQHIVSILSTARVGTELEAGIINYGLAKATIVASNSDGIDFSVSLIDASYEMTNKNVQYTSTLVLSHPRPPVMQRLLRDLASMGLNMLCCYVPELGEKSYLNASFWNKCKKIMLLGAMQGRQWNVPMVHSCVGLGNALSILEKHVQHDSPSTVYVPVSLDQESSMSLNMFLHCICSNDIDHHTAIRNIQYCQQHSKQSNSFYATLCTLFSQSILQLKNKQQEKIYHFIYFIGPERHYSNFEETLLRQLPLYPVHIGQQVLRSEVAVLLTQGLWNMQQEYLK